MGSEYLFLFVGDAQHMRAHQEYLDSTHVQVMTGRNAEREIRGEYHAGEPEDVIAKPGKGYIEGGQPSKTAQHKITEKLASEHRI